MTSSTPFSITCPDWVNHHPYWVDLKQVTELLSSAMSEESYGVGSIEMILLLFNRLADNNAHDQMIVADDFIYADSLAVNTHLDGWLNDIGRKAGYEFNDSVLIASWVTDSMPKTRAAIRSLMSMCHEHLRNAEQEYQSAYGYTPSEAYDTASITGEPFEQVKARLHHARKGLTVVVSHNG